MSYPNISKEDLDFMKWLDSPACEKFWDKDERGEKIILKTGWEKAQHEYNKLKHLIDNKTVFYSEEFRG